MIFKLPNEHSFILNNLFFFLLFLTIKIKSKGNMKRDFVQKQIIKKVNNVLFYFILKERQLINKKIKFR